MNVGLKGLFPRSHLFVFPMAQGYLKAGQEVTIVREGQKVSSVEVVDQTSSESLRLQLPAGRVTQR